MKVWTAETEGKSMKTNRVSTGILSLLAVIGFLTPRSAKTQAVIYDNKAMPGAACHVINANSSWIDGGASVFVPRSQGAPG